MFPGYNKGETTQRIASGVFAEISGYEYGIQFASNYILGEFVPHVRIMTTGYEDVESAKSFALPYIVKKSSSLRHNYPSLQLADFGNKSIFNFYKPNRNNRPERSN